MSKSKKIEFVIRGEQKSLTVQQVEEGLKKVTLGPAQIHVVKINGNLYPVKKAFAELTKLDVLDFQTAEARRIFKKLGFEVIRNVK